ncbi:putative bifunctional diguanylate cyclase/phosphodiesterase [Oscillospiraceae bacterium LTW-04]|nr:bifunctional diguanylate cyclase/phosphodiesterase [Oscillospiraceae bacterium MB24-C1]
MMREARPKPILHILLIMFFIYFAIILMGSDFWGNILSPIVAFLSSLLIFISAKRTKSSKLYDVLLFFSTLIWGIADLAWLIYENVLLIDPISINFLNALYVIPNLIFTIFLTHYIFKTYSNWNLWQLVIDIFTFSTMGSILIWSFIFSKTKLAFNWDFNYILTMFYLFLDFYLIVAIGLICFSKSFKRIKKSSLFVLAGMFIYVVTDYYYAYLGLIRSYDPNTFIDVVYMLCNVLFAVGIAYEAVNPFIGNNSRLNQLSENLRKPTKLVFLNIAAFYFLYLTNIFSLQVFTIASVICILYWVLTTNLLANMLDKLMLKTEKEMNEHLEKLITKRTMELNRVNQHLQEISNRDALTGLYNRRYLVSHLDSLVSIKTPFALLYIDVNRFKSINDSYGHEMGDKVLCTLCGHLLGNHSPNCTVFRIGGDEIAITIENYADKANVALIAEKILKTIQAPIKIESFVFTLNASIGIALYPQDADDRDILMQYADMAMYEVKSMVNRNNYLFFNAELSEKNKRHYEIDLALRSANYDKEFVLYFQPQFSVKTNSLMGMEALIRWVQPQKGFISPSEFIPVAEKNGTIFDIGEWVINRAFAQIKKWNQTYDLNLKMGINISPIQIENIGFIDWFREKLQNEDIKPNWIDLEITESIAIKPDALTAQIFDLLHEIGVYTSIDDFGTGYSSLSYIKRFNIDRLKIAKELIDNIENDQNSLLIVQAIVMMAKGMQIKTIAEGVEDVNQLKFLNQLGCDEIQGYFFGEPVTGEAFEVQYIKEKESECLV